MWQADRFPPDGPDRSRPRLVLRQANRRARRNPKTPRPIAWVTSQSREGVRNLSPFSFFNALGDNPPTIALGMVSHLEQRLKDTPLNIRDTGEFVVHLVDEAHGEAMNLTSVDAPADFDENLLARLELVPSARVAVQRIASAPVSFECKLPHFIETGPYQAAIIAEIVYAHVRDEFITDRDRIHIDVSAMKLISRLHGAGWYGRQTDTFKCCARPGRKSRKRAVLQLLPMRARRSKAAWSKRQ